MLWRNLHTNICRDVELAKNSFVCIISDDIAREI
jgi:hypothetical protein